MADRVLRDGTNTTVDVTTPGYVEIDATGGGGVTPPSDVPLHIGANRYGSLPGVAWGAGAVSTAMGTSTAWRYFPIYLANPASFDAIHVNVWVIGSGAAARLALYDADADWLPTDLVVDAGAIDASTNGLKTNTFTQVDLDAGRYFLAMQSNGTTFNSLDIQGHLVGLWGWGLNAQLPAGSLTSGTTTYGAAPSTAYTTGLALGTASIWFSYKCWLRGV